MSGELLTFSYIGDGLNGLSGTLTRQNSVRPLTFVCRCERCSFPLDMSRGMGCPHCCTKGNVASCHPVNKFALERTKAQDTTVTASEEVLTSHAGVEGISLQQTIERKLKERNAVTLKNISATKNLSKLFPPSYIFDVENETLYRDSPSLWFCPHCETLIEEEELPTGLETESFFVDLVPKLVDAGTCFDASSTNQACSSPSEGEGEDVNEKRITKIKKYFHIEDPVKSSPSSTKGKSKSTKSSESAEASTSMPTIVPDFSIKEETIVAFESALKTTNHHVYVLLVFAWLQTVLECTMHHLYVNFSEEDWLKIRSRIRSMLMALHTCAPSNVIQQLRIYGLVAHLQHALGQNLVLCPGFLGTLPWGQKLDRILCCEDRLSNSYCAVADKVSTTGLEADRKGAELENLEVVKFIDTADAPLKISTESPKECGLYSLYLSKLKFVGVLFKIWGF